jgi:hypothetical protein
MIICQVDAWLSAMGKDAIERELGMLEEVLAALEGELIGAEVGTDLGRLVAYVRAESELQVSDVFEAFHFAVERIAYLGWSHETSVDFTPSASQGMWRYRPVRSANPAAVPPASARPALSASP